MKSKFKITRADYLKAMRKARRDEEIREHLHPVNINRVHKSITWKNLEKKAMWPKIVGKFFITI